MFIRALEREVMRALVMRLNLKTKIKVEVGVIRMVYSIIQVHTCYDFTTNL